MNTKHKVNIFENFNSYWVIVLLSGFVSLVFMIYSISEPITYDELFTVWAGKSILSKGVPYSWSGEFNLWHPPLYSYLLAAFFKWFGISEVSARVLGIIGSFVTAFLIYCTASYLYDKQMHRHFAGMLAAVIYILNPANIQGALILDWDCALLPVAVMSMLLTFLLAIRKEDFKIFMIFGFIFGIALWIKLTTPLLIAVIFLIFIFLKTNSNNNVKWTIYSIFVGLIFWITTWTLYSFLFDVPISYPLNYLFESFFAKQAHGSFTERLYSYLQSLVRLSLWWSPSLIILALIAIWNWIKNTWNSRGILLKDLPLLCFSVGTLGYIWVGGVPFGFPKYHAPFLPMLSLVAADFIMNKIETIAKRDFIIFSVLLIAIILFWVMIIGDPVYTFNFMVRDFIIYKPHHIRAVYEVWFMQIFQLVVLFMVSFFILRMTIKSYNWHQCIVIGLTIITLSASLGLNINQAKADYLTRYCYGDSETKRVLDYLKEKATTGKIVVATRDIIYYTDNGSPYWSDSLWNSAGKFNTVIHRPDIFYVIYSVGHHSISQFQKTFFDPEVKKTLLANFNESKIGTYTIWSKK